jgi:hypothetical protein
MLDVFVGIGLTSIMILFIIVRAIRLNRTEPWFAPFKPREKPGNTAATPWRRSQ